MKNNLLKTLVVGIDLSDYSKLVAQQANLLAEELNLSLVFVYCYEDAANYSDPLILDPSKIERLYAAKIRQQYHIHINHKVLVRFGSADKEILNVAKKQKNPLIMVGHKGNQTIARFFLGSVAEKLSAATPYPLWIHRGERTFVPKKILVPSDLSAHSEKAINRVAVLQKSFKSEMEIFHVLTEPVPILDYQAWAIMIEAMKKADDKKLRAFEKKHPSTHVTRSQGPVAECIHQHSKNFDLIALAPRQKSKIIFGRVSSKVIRSGDTPVLIVP